MVDQRGQVVRELANAPYLEGYLLHADCLLSRFGFEDGDVPEHVLDLLDEAELPYPDRDQWHAVLKHLVRTRLLRAIDADVEVYEIDTLHNPIRARSVNGLDVTHERDAEILEGMLPEYVYVPWSEVVQLLEHVLTGRGELT